MLWTITVVLIILWALGMTSKYRMKGFQHILMVVAIIVALLNLIQDRSIM